MIVFFFNATSSGALCTFAGAIRPSLLNDRPAVIAALIFVKMADGTATVLKNLQLSCQKSSSVLLWRVTFLYLICPLFYVTPTASCFFQKLSFKPQNTTVIRFNRSYQTGKYPFFGFNFFITIHTLESED